MTSQEIIDLFGDRGVTLDHYRDRECLIVEGFLAVYAIDDITHEIRDINTGRWISIVQSSTGSHRVDNKLSLVMALLNDLKMVDQIPTLKNEVYHNLHQLDEEHNRSIVGALEAAVNECSETIEEEGGVILVKGDDYCYYKLRNQNTGTSIAPVLWTADRDEYAKNVIPAYAKGWRHYASFHTHPQFLPLPSGIDYDVLFPGFPVNYIYSPVTQEITQWNVGEDLKSFKHAATYKMVAKRALKVNETSAISTGDERELQDSLTEPAES